MADRIQKTIEPRVVSNVEAGRLLGCSARSIQRYRRAGLLVTVVIQGRSRVLTSSIHDLIAKGDSWIPFAIACKQRMTVEEHDDD